MSKAVRNIRSLFEEYRRKCEQIAQLNADSCLICDVVRGSSAEPPYSTHAIRVAGVDRDRREYNRLRVERLKAECAYVEAAAALAPSQVRAALTLHYLDGLTWEQAAERMQADFPQATTDGIRMSAYRYLDTVK